jgi:hypothetical protein
MCLEDEQADPPTYALMLATVLRAKTIGNGTFVSEQRLPRLPRAKALAGSFLRLGHAIAPVYQNRSFSQVAERHCAKHGCSKAQNSKIPFRDAVTQWPVTGVVSAAGELFIA